MGWNGTKAEQPEGKCNASKSTKEVKPLKMAALRGGGDYLEAMDEAQQESLVHSAACRRDGASIVIDGERGFSWRIRRFSVTFWN